MAMIEFVRNYTDHSTDRGYQFEFRCDHCYSGYMSSYSPSVIGTAGGLLQAAGNLFGGILGSAGSSSYEIQRAIGGPAHDRALQQAVTEVKQKFRRCQRCGRWVCAEICWNERAAQCTGCTPKYEQEVISMRTEAQIQATQQQLYEKARGTDYVSGIDMNPDAQVRISPPAADPSPPGPPVATRFLPDSWQSPAPPAQAPAAPSWPVSAAPASTPLAPSANVAPAAAFGGWTDVAVPAPAPVRAAVAQACSACGASLQGGRFCSSCGAPVAPPGPRQCAFCGHASVPSARFCEDCGGKLQ